VLIAYIAYILMRKYFRASYSDMVKKRYAKFDFPWPCVAYAMNMYIFCMWEKKLKV